MEPFECIHRCQIFIDEYLVHGLHTISRLQYQRLNMIFDNQIRYNRLCQQVIHIGGDSAINYIKIF